MHGPTFDLSRSHSEYDYGTRHADNHAPTSTNPPQGIPSPPVTAVAAWPVDTYIVHAELRLADARDIIPPSIAQPPGWTSRAACLDQPDIVGVGNDTFTDKRPALTVAQIARARALCNTCPVFMPCLRAGLENREPHGIWAGTTKRERDRIWRMVEARKVTLAEVYTDFAAGRTRRYETLRGASDGPQA